MKIAVTMVSMGKSYNKGEIDVKGFVDFCGTLGIEGVDICEYYWKDKKREVKEVSRYVADNNLKVSAFAVGNEFTKMTEKERQEQIAYVKEGIDTAQAIGADKMRVFGGRPVPGKTRKEWLEIVVECLYPCLEYAKKNGIVLAIENHGDLPGRSEDILYILSKINSPYLKCNIDIANFAAYNMEKKEDPVSATKNLIKYAVHSHVKDFKYFPDSPKGMAGCILGEGFIPIADCLKVFMDNGYDGYFSLEFEGQEHYPEKEGIIRSIENLKELGRNLQKS